MKVRRKLAEKMRQLPDEGWFLQALVKDELSSLLSSVRGQNVCTAIELILQTIINVFTVMLLLQITVATTSFRTCQTSKDGAVINRF